LIHAPTTWLLRYTHSPNLFLVLLLPSADPHAKPVLLAPRRTEKKKKPSNPSSVDLYPRCETIRDKTSCQLDVRPTSKRPRRPSAAFRARKSDGPVHLICGMIFTLLFCGRKQFLCTRPIFFTVEKRCSALFLFCRWVKLGCFILIFVCAAAFVYIAHTRPGRGLLDLKKGQQPSLNMYAIELFCAGNIIWFCCHLPVDVRLFSHSSHSALIQIVVCGAAVMK
jgi:hypothetical protein